MELSKPLPGVKGIVRSLRKFQLLSCESRKKREGWLMFGNSADWAMTLVRPLPAGKRIIGKMRSSGEFSPVPELEKLQSSWAAPTSRNSWRPLNWKLRR